MKWLAEPGGTGLQPGGTAHDAHNKRDTMQNGHFGDTSIKIGGKYLIRTVTHYLTGEVVAVHPQEVVIRDAAWVADTGRFATALREGTLSEVEPYPDGEVVIGRGAIVDAAAWTHPLPRKTQ